MLEDAPLNDGAGSNERPVLNDLPLSTDLPLSEGSVPNERLPAFELVTELFLPTLPEAVVEVALSLVTEFLRMFSAPLLVSELVKRVVLDDPPERKESAAVLVFLVTGSIVVTLLVLLSTTRLEMSLVSWPVLS